WICRLNSACVSQATIGTSSPAISLSTTGVKTTTVSGSQQAPNVNDRVAVLLAFDNDIASVQTFNFTSNQLLDSPFTPSDVPLDDEGLMITPVAVQGPPISVW